MVLPLLAAVGGTVLGEYGKQQGARAYQDQLREEQAREEALARKRRHSIRLALAAMSPEQQLATALRESQSYRPQQEAAQSIARAYGVDNAAVGDEFAELGPTINDRAWQRAFGVVDDQTRGALADESVREGNIDDKAWWWQRFMPQRLERAGQTGEGARTWGSMLQAYGLGGMTKQMGQPAAAQPWGQSGSVATNTETGARMTDDLRDRSWLGVR